MALSASLRSLAPSPGASVGRALWGLLLVAGLAACSAPRSGDPPRSAADMGLSGSPIDWTGPSDLFLIAGWEDARSPADGQLVRFLQKHSDARVRARAALAAGRLPYPRVDAGITAALCGALEDEDASVRLAAAFALGQRGDPQAAGVLINHWNHPDPALRAALARATATVQGPGVQSEVIRAMQDPDLGVRIEAVQATAMWDPDEEGAGAVDSALLDTITTAARGDGIPGLVWRGLYALQRRGAAKGRGLFLEHLGSADPLARIFSAKGLGKVEADAQVIAALSGALDDLDWRVAAEAAASLGALGDPDSAEALAEAAEHPLHHVRAAAVGALGNLAAPSKAGRNRLWRSLRDLSSTVRAQALESLARALPSEEAIGAVEDGTVDSDPVVRIGAARAAAHLRRDLAVALLTRLLEDEDLRVVEAALGGLGEHLTPEVRDTLERFLGHVDNGLVLAALTTLATEPRREDVEALREVVRRVRGDIAPEIAWTCIGYLENLGTDEAAGLLEHLLAHTDPFVRDEARRALRESFGRTPAAPVVPKAAAAALPRAGLDYPRWTHNPFVEVATTRGAMVFELFPREAPIHVHNFLTQAESGHYDGLRFHRVVPDFVIQGGDYRGDGNGGGSWRGSSLRHEFGERKFTRGSLGTPRYADPDSGGSQIFVTHRPTPHLDGRYTIFGELRSGGDTLDHIEVGDRILKVRLLTPGTR